MSKFLEGVGNYLMIALYLIVLFCMVTCVIWAGHNFDFISLDVVAILSCVVTLALSVTMGLKPLNYVMSRFNRSEIEKEYKRDMEMAELIKQKIMLENDIRDRDDQIKTMEQSSQFVPQIGSDIKLQTFTISKAGYVVKQEKFAPLINHQDYKECFQSQKTVMDKIPGGRQVRQIIQEATDFIKDKDNWEVFYVWKHINKYAIGIDFENVKYRVDENTGQVTFYKLELSVLHGIKPSADEQKQSSQNAIKRTWIINLNNKDGSCEIINDKDYNAFKTEYAKQQGYSIEESMENEAKNLCKDGTKGLQKLLMDIYHDKIQFVGEIEEEGCSWYPLLGSEGNSQIANRLIADLIIAIKAINLYTSNNEGLDKALIPEQASA